MEKVSNEGGFFGTASIGKILLRVAPPVMPAQLIQAAEGHVGVFWESESAACQGLHITARVNTSRGIRCRAVAETLPDYAASEEPTLEDAYLYLISRGAV